MSTLSQQDGLDPNSLIYYAPRRLRERVNDAPSMVPNIDNAPTTRLQLEANDPQNHQPSNHRGVVDTNLDNDGAELRLPPNWPHRTGIEHEPRSPVRLRHSFRKRLALVIIASVVTAAGIALEVMFIDPSLWQRFTRAITNLSPENVPAPTHAVASPGSMIKAPLPVDLYVPDYTRDANFFTGMRASSGATFPEQWRIRTGGLPETFLTQEAQQQSVDSERAKADKLEAPNENADAAKGAKRVVSVRQISPDEAASLLRRAEDLVLNGDLPAARLLLQRLAEAHNARAAFDLASTYDPSMLKALGAVSVSPDLVLARTWYERAQDWGSGSASERLKALASVGD
jgi:hypothetical protein